MMDRGNFLCLCPPQYHGDTCDSSKQHLLCRQPWLQQSGSVVVMLCVLCAVVLECRYRNGGCMQYCRDLPGGAGVQCGCADGFKLEPDGQRCFQSGNTHTTRVLPL